MNVFKKFLSVALCIGLFGAAGQTKCSQISEALKYAQPIILKASALLEDTKKFSSAYAQKTAKELVETFKKFQDLRYVLQDLQERNKKVAELKAKIKEKDGELAKDGARKKWLVAKNTLHDFASGLADGICGKEIKPSSFPKTDPQKRLIKKFYLAVSELECQNMVLKGLGSQILINEWIGV